MIKILFISHDANRAGAQLLLLDFLFWLKSNKQNIYFDILLVKGGELENEFNELGKVYRWFNNRSSIFNNKISNLYYEKSLLRKLELKKYDLIYSNTIINGIILNKLNFLKTPVITHVHELNYWIKKAGINNLELIKKTTSLYVAASKAVKNNLISYGIPENKINLIYEFTNVSKKLINKNKSLKNILGLSEDTIIIGASGGETFRKGKDLFVMLAIHILHRTNLPIHFVWIGGEVSEEINFDLNKIQFSNKIHFIDHLENAADYFNEFYVFAMLSRDDPFPVVNLEAGLLGVPVICFDNSGGTPELLDEDIASVIPYMDISSFGNRILWFIENKLMRDEIGNNLSKKIRENYDLNIIAQKLFNTINKMIYEKN